MPSEGQKHNKKYGVSVHPFLHTSPGEPATHIVNPIKPAGSNPRKKATIPSAMKEQIWLRSCGKVFESKCCVTWCQNRMNVWDFQAGHNIPESRGGPTSPENLIPICSRCNLSMGNRYSITEWNALGGESNKSVPEAPPPSKWCCFC
jgi:5-methylcytosine-specific restriction endonuclease McrA